MRTLLAVVLEQSGAQAAYLLFARGDALSLAARASVGEHGVDATLLPSQPLGPASTQVPAAIVRHVLRTREPVRLDDAAASPTFAGDPYVAARKPRSVLCLPLVRQHQVVALLYLENDLTTGVFTPNDSARSSCWPPRPPSPSTTPAWCSASEPHAPPPKRPSGGPPSWPRPAPCCRSPSIGSRR
ncbi:GAF domain-containing protein [Nannocystis pusilla]|uniref:GAF domain-containing protein n=1 Tax=Nannocystis pusilla TaxID=889268 RepID=UPI003B7C4F55